MPARLRWDWSLLAVIVWAALSLGLVGYGYARPRGHTVYDIYAPAARNWWAGKDLYAEQPGLDHYRYSPLFAVGLTPFALLPDSWGGALWRVFNYGVYAAGLWGWGRRILPARLNRSQLAFLFLLALPVSLHSMHIGQANVLMIGALLLGLAAVADDHWNWAAGWLALATLIKGYPLALALLLAVRYPRRFAPRFAAALGLGLLLPFAAHRPAVVLAQYGSWWAHLRHSTSIMRERLRSIDHLFDIYHYPLSPRLFAWLELLAGGAVLVLYLAREWRTTDRRQGLTWLFVLFSLWVVLFGPATEKCTYIVIAPTIAWMLLDVFSRPALWSTRLLLVASLLLMGLLGTDLFRGTIRNFFNEHGGQPVGAILLVACLPTQIWRGRQKAEGGRWKADRGTSHAGQPQAA